MRSSYGIGQSATRVEDQRFLIGRGRYVDDMTPTGQCHAFVVLSPHAHARIKKIDTRTAKAAPGVLAVLTGADATADGLGDLWPNFMPEDLGGPKGWRTPRPILVRDRVRCVGDRVALVVAETLHQARDAAEFLKIDYEVLPVITGLEEAVKPGATAVWEECPGNVSFMLTAGDERATEEAFARAAHKVSLRLENNRLAPSSMEPRISLGEWDPADETFTLHTSSQAPHAIRQQMANFIFKLPETRIRVVCPDVGGGFGVKGDAYPEDALVLWAARRIGRPVKWVCTRSDAILGDTHARDQVVYAELALDANAKILAIRSQSLHAVGAYVVAAAAAPLMYSIRYTPGVYDVRTVWCTNKAVFTHTAPMGVYRGAGRPEGNYVIERLLDRAAAQIGISREEIRRRNFISSSQMPYATQTGSVYDSGEFEKLMNECLELSDWKGYEARRAASERAGKLRGRSVICFIEHAGIFNERMEIRFDPGGMATIVAGTHSHGQGHATTFAQLVHEWLGVPFESIRYVQGDTETVPFGRGSYAARSAVLGGSALRIASDQIIEKAKLMASHLLEASVEDIEFKDGNFQIRGTNRMVSLVNAAKSLYRKAGMPKGLTLGLEASGTFAGDIPSYPNGCHVVEVEIDPATGFVSLDRYTVVDDVGIAINPMICEGQIQGGIAQGVGQALMENIVYDEDGQLLSGSYMDYAMPRADDLVMVHSKFSCVPCATNPLGIKGVGESGAIGAPPAIMNAVIDALGPLGIDHVDMPATPFRIWQLINGAKKKS